MIYSTLFLQKQSIPLVDEFPSQCWGKSLEIFKQGHFDDLASLVYNLFHTDCACAKTLF